MSNYFDILTAVKTSILTVTTPVVIRKKILKLESDPVPIVIIAPGVGGERIAGQQMGKGVWYDYPVNIAYITAGNRSLTEGLEDYLDAREAIRNQLYQPRLATDIKVFDTNFTVEEAVRWQEFIGSNYDVTGWQMLYRVAEKRVA